MNTINTPHITQLRATLMETLNRLGTMGRDGNAIDPEQMRAQVQQAQAMKGLADTLVDTARVEIEYIKATGSDRSEFLEPQRDGVVRLTSAPTANNPFPGALRGGA